MKMKYKTIKECCKMIMEAIESGNYDVKPILELIEERERRCDIIMYGQKCQIDELKKITEMKENSFTQLRILDEDTGLDHIIGSNLHDVLYVENGIVRYYNLQDGGSDGDGYRFVEKMVVQKYE